MSGRLAEQQSKPLHIAGHHLPAGTDVCPCALLVHHRPDLYPQPLEFRPERFLEHHPTTSEWFPFGGATRRCPGAAFAQLEIKIILQHITQTLRLTPSHSRPEQARPRSIVLVPVHGAKTVGRRR